MEIKFVELYDCLGKGADTQFGKPIKDFEYHPGCWLPNIGTLMRLDSGAYNGLYEVVAVIYSEPTKLVRIKLEKYIGK